MKIAVDFNIDTIFREYVYVNAQKECKCDYDVMLPLLPINKMPTDDWRMCASCGGYLTNNLVREYNRYNGYSGFDE